MDEPTLAEQVKRPRDPTAASGAESSNRSLPSFPPLRMVPLALALVCGVGTVLRLDLLLSQPSLSVDEAMLSLNLAARSWSGLLRPLDYGQTAPLVFLWAERLAIVLGGVTAFALRTVPFVAGLLLPVAVWALARQLLEPADALLAAAFAAVSPLLIEYAVIVKPYGVDALLTVLLLWLTVHVIEAPSDPRRWYRLLGAGAPALWASTPAVFALVGVVTALFLAPGMGQSPQGIRKVVTAASLWGGLFALEYILWYRSTATSAYMQAFWQASFFSPDSPETLARGWQEARYFLRDAFVGSQPQGWSVPLLFGLCAIGGVSITHRRGGWAAALVAAPLGAVAIASALHVYPLAPRLLVFAVPLIIVLLVAGLSEAAGWLLRPRWGFTVAGAIWLAVELSGWMTHPYGTDETRPLVQEFKRLRRPDDPVYVYAGGVPAWTFYTTDWKHPDTARLAFLAQLAGPSGPAFHNAAGRGHGVANEGSAWVIRYRGGQELIGIPTGMQWRDLTGWTQPWPDPGWAENEVARIRATGGRAVWVFFADCSVEPVSRLHNALRQAGATLTYQRAEGGSARLLRYRLPARPPARATRSARVQ